jgi:ABC-type tungstate transport system substrate-binding protein
VFGEIMEPGSSTYNNYNPDKGRHSFEIASIVMGTLSLVLLCTGVLAIPTGALGIIFCTLSRKRNCPLTTMAKLGLVFSLMGMILGAMVSIVAVYTVMTDPSVLEDVKQMYVRYGMEMPTYLEYFGEGGSL